MLHAHVILRRSSALSGVWLYSTTLLLLRFAVLESAPFTGQERRAAQLAAALAAPPARAAPQRAAQHMALPAAAVRNLATTMQHSQRALVRAFKQSAEKRRTLKGVHGKLFHVWPTRCLVLATKHCAAVRAKAWCLLSHAEASLSSLLPDVVPHVTGEHFELSLLDRNGNP